MLGDVLQRSIKRRETTLKFKIYTILKLRFKKAKVLNDRSAKFSVVHKKHLQERCFSLLQEYRLARKAKALTYLRFDNKINHPYLMAEAFDSLKASTAY